MTWEPWEPRDREYRPLRVTATMHEPVIYSGDLIHLDGILAYAAFRDLDRRTRCRMPPTSAPWLVDLELPLARWLVDVGETWAGDKRLLWSTGRRNRGRTRTTKLWGWRASAESVSSVLRGSAEIRKKPELDQMRRYAGDRSVNVGAGTFKGYDLKMPTVFAHSFKWYAYGDGSEVARLLRTYVQAIGKKHQLGYGTVASWGVSAMDADHSVESESGLARRMPVQCMVEGALTCGAIRPPYFHRSRIIECVEPLAC